MPTAPLVRGVFGGIPGYFKACCWHVSHQTRDVAGAGYDYPARELTRHLESESPYDLDDDEWFDQLAVLRGLIDARNGAAVIAWFLERFPKCMALIPKRRREQFLKGVYEGADDEDVTW